MVDKKRKPPAKPVAPYKGNKPAVERVAGVDHCKFDDKAIFARGLCRGCWLEVMEAIKAGKLTEEQAIERGLIRASQPGRPYGSGEERLKMRSRIADVVASQGPAKGAAKSAGKRSKPESPARQG